MGEVVAAGLLAHVPTIMLPRDERVALNEGEEISLVPGLKRLRQEIFETLDYDTVVVLDFSFARCAWRTIRRGRERAGYWGWVWRYRRRYLPAVMRGIAARAQHADLHVLRNPAQVRRFIAQAQAGP